MWKGVLPRRRRRRRQKGKNLNVPNCHTRESGYPMNIKLESFLRYSQSSFTSVALVAILSLTFYLRLLFFGQMIDADVGNIAYMGWRMAEGEVLIGLEGPGKPPLYAMFYALYVWFFGPSVPGLKMFGAIFVLMAVIAIYWGAKVAYGEKAGLLAALLFGGFLSASAFMRIGERRSGFFVMEFWGQGPWRRSLRFSSSILYMVMP